ncbi:MAG: PepSY-associated TM helix domain-containing protein [Pseudomonadota bacterium]
MANQAKQDKQDRHKRIYDLHSWTGVVLGLMMFFVCFTGSVALFHHELEPWEDAAKRGEIVANPVPIHNTLVEFAETKSNELGIEPQFVNVALPHGEHGHYDLSISGRKTDDSGEFDFASARYSTATGEELAYRTSGANRLLYDLHRDLAWPDVLGGRQVGRIIVGLVGIAFLLLILSGIIAHTKFTKELFTLRFLKSVRLKWQDSHKVLGLWTSPFAFIIALTGAFLGVIALLLPLLAFVTIKGDQEKLIAELGLEQPQAVGIAAPMIPADEIGPRAHPETGNPLTYIRYNNWGDQNATATLTYKAERRLLYADNLTVNAVTGEQQAGQDIFLTNGPFAYILATFSPLHYGTYGGVFLKIIYFVLGMSIAIMSALGNMMWIERRRHGGEGEKSDRYYAILSAINTGVCAGLPLAAVAVLGFDKLWWGTEVARYSGMVWFFFGAWIVAALFGYFRGNDYKANRELMAVSGFGLIGLAPLNWALTGDVMWSNFTTGAAGSAYFDLAFILLGVAAVFVAAKLPAERPEDKRRKRKTKKVASTEPALEPAE